VAGTVGFDLHRGVVALGRRPSPPSPDRLLAAAAGSPARAGGPPLVAVLEGLNDHENIGALFRNAAAFGVAGIVLDPTCADPLYRRSIRVSMGHVLHLPFARLEPWPAGLDQVRAAGFVVAALSPRPAFVGGRRAVGLGALGQRACRSGAPGGIALLLGAEGPGLSDGALAAADAVVSIPMAHGVDSLNVATAAAIAFYALTGS
ncbi:MAG TPA: RNA methyltransferase, partial [Acidimicrobiales bacterium]|nr:RNA methyltransferase [Acidimicrobiales bacterium]